MPKCAAVAEQRLEPRQVARRGDDQDLADAGKHQHAERIVDHRLVVDRQQLLRDRQRRRIKARAAAASKDNPLQSLTPAQATRTGALACLRKSLQWQAFRFG